MTFKTKKSIKIFSDGSLYCSIKSSFTTNQINFIDNNFQNIKLLKNNLGKVERQEGLKFKYRKKFL